MRFLTFLKNPKVILVLIIILATALRIINLANWPASFNQDEALNGYEAYSILKTGHDHRGNFLPIFFEGFGEYVDNRLPLYIYTSVPSMAVFGLNKFSSRLPSVIFGVLTVLAAYFLAKQIFKRKSIALLAAFFLAISPWHIFLSRLAIESITVPLFFILTVLFILKGFEEKKYFLLLAGLGLAILFYTYHTAKIYPPLLGLFFLFFFRKKIKENKNWLLLSFLIFVIISLPLLITQFTSWSRIQTRFNGITILNYPFIAPFLFIFNYLTYFSPSFLLIHYPFFVIFFFLFGIGLLWKFKKERTLFLGLIFMALFSPSILKQNPHSHRAMALLPFIEIIAAFGVWQVIEKLKNFKIKPSKIYLSVIIIFLIFLCFNLIFLIKDHYPYKFFGGFYEYVPKEVIDYIKENQSKYNKVFFTRNVNQPYIFFLFFLSYPPEKVQSPNFLERVRIGEGGTLEMVLSFDKYKFCNIDECYSPKKNNIYVARENEVVNLKPKKIFSTLRGDIFRIITND